MFFAYIQFPTENDSTTIVYVLNVLTLIYVIILQRNSVPCVPVCLGCFRPKSMFL